MDELDRTVEPGWDVYGSDDEKIGTVHIVGPDYLEVENGIFFIKNLYVPESAVADVEPTERRVVLDRPKDEVGEMGCSEPPVEGGAPVSGGAWGQGAPGGEDLWSRDPERTTTMPAGDRTAETGDDGALDTTPDDRGDPLG